MNAKFNNQPAKAQASKTSSKGYVMTMTPDNAEIVGFALMSLKSRTTDAGDKTRIEHAYLNLDTCPKIEDVVKLTNAEHDALVAVAEAAELAGTWHTWRSNGGENFGGLESGDIARKIKSALANLAAVREGKAVQS